MREKAENITVLFPADLARDLRTLVPKGERSKLIVEATREKLSQLRLTSASPQATVAKPGVDQSDLILPDDLATWLRDLRKSVREQLGRRSEDDTEQ